MSEDRERTELRRMIAETDKLIETFRLLAERFRYPKMTYAAKFALVAGIVNIASGF